MFEQVKLTYAFGDLEPYIDTATMEVHYNGHLATFTKACNDLVKQVPGLRDKTSEQILLDLNDVPDHYRTAVRNNFGGFFNHNMYFESLSPNGAREAKGPLRDQIEKDFKTFENLVDVLKQAALTQFGSGYAWLVYSKAESKLMVAQSNNQENPMMNSDTKCLLPIDVWEHAYYLKHKNKRAAYLEDVFQVIDWDMVARRFEQIRRFDFVRA